LDGIDPCLPSVLGFSELDHLDVVLQNLLLLLLSRFNEYVPQPGPGCQELRRRARLLVERALSPVDGCELLGDTLLFGFETGKFVPDARETTRTLRLEYVEHPPNRRPGD
jgi:hypothetical protein